VAVCSVRRAVAITTAVVPVAGLATRLRPLSRGVPKALLPVAGRPVIGHIVDELAACGVERVVLVTGRGRAGFAAHFAEAEGPEIVCVEQPKPLGLADAILRAAPEIDGAFAIALGDAILGHGRPVGVLERLAEAVRQGASVAIAVEEVAPADTVRYGIVAPAAAGESRGAAGAGESRGAAAAGESRGAAGAGESRGAAGEAEPFPIAGVVEKPAPENAPSRLAVAGRYVATPALLDALRATPLGAGGELLLADALATLDGVVGVRLAPGEERFDVGTVPGYCAAFVDHALNDPVLGPGLRAQAHALLDDER
jgi:UTP--glucose-1-phosphate uridylyltransferase